MTQLRDLLDQAAGPTPPTSLSAEGVYAAGRRRRSVASVGRAGLVILTLVALGGVAYGSARLAAQPSTIGDDGARSSVVAAIAADGDHLYAVLVDCSFDLPGSPSLGSPPDPSPPGQTGTTADPSGTTVYPSGTTVYPSGTPADPASGAPAHPSSGAAWSPVCQVRLMGSDDGGREWSVRSREPGENPGLDALGVPVRGVLTYAGYFPNRDPRISLDGGRTWRSIEVTEDPIPQVPAGGWATESTSLSPNVGQVLGVDPGTARAAPLANQPFDGVQQVMSMPDKSLIVARTYGDPSRFAISHDNGLTWSAARNFPDMSIAGSWGSESGPMTTVDGVNLYVIAVHHFDDQPFNRRTVYSSNDGGVTWKHRALPGGSAEDVRSGGTVSSYYVGPEGNYVTRDGAHVVVSTDDNGLTYWASRNGGASYETVTHMNGLSNETMRHLSVQTMPQGDHLAWDVGSHGYYYSADGWNWQRITID